MTVNAFDEKVDYLIKAQQQVAKRDAMSEELDKMKNHQKKLSKNIVLEEKSISDEIATTIKKRKQELETSFDKRIMDTLSRQKKVFNKRDKEKTELINGRINEETKDIKQLNRDLQTELKTMFKQNKMPKFCSKKWYYVLFMPKGIKEILMFIFNMIIGFVGIPVVLFLLSKYVWFADKDLNFPFLVTLIIAIVIILEMMIYFSVSSSTKIKHLEVLQKGRIIRDKINANNKRINAISHSINKDKDESQYDLKSYDKSINKLKNESNKISELKLKALKSFDEETVSLITDEINGRRLQAVNTMKSDKSEIDAKIALYEKKYSEQALNITETYAPYLGEEFCKVDKLEILISIMQEGAAQTVSEAIAAYKGKPSK